MKISCVWEHNGDDSLLYAMNLPGAFARGENKDAALNKMKQEAVSFLAWQGKTVEFPLEIEIVQESACDLAVCDADSDVLFDSESRPLSAQEYAGLKALALKSAADFLRLYHAMPDVERSVLPARKTFYGQVPRTAKEMYLHTKNVNAYYFGEIGVETDNEGSVLECRTRGFESLEKQPDHLSNAVVEGSYGERWSLRKLLRRFIWHDRIHAKAMYRMAVKTYGKNAVPDVFCFETGTGETEE